MFKLLVIFVISFPISFRLCPFLSYLSAFLPKLGSAQTLIRMSAWRIHCGRNFGFLRMTPTLVISNHCIWLRERIRNTLLSVNAAPVYGDLRLLRPHSRCSHNPTQAFPSSINIADSTVNSSQQSCGLLRSYFSSVSTSSTTAPFPPILGVDSSESLAIPLFNPSLVEFAIGNLAINVRLGVDGLPC